MRKPLLAFIPPRNPLAGATQTGLSLVALTVLVYYGVFRLPFRFPPSQRLSSASYAFGFNNGVAIAATAALLGIVTRLYLLWRGETTELPIAFPHDRTLRGRWMFMGLFALVALFYIGL